VGNYLKKGELSLSALDGILANAKKIAPNFSADFSSMTGSCTFPLSRLSAVMIHHASALSTEEPILAPPAADYTGIIIMANTALRIHGRETSALIKPCLFPKIWDTDMRLIYQRETCDPSVTGAGTNNGANARTIARYTTPESVFKSTPSGLTKDLETLVGKRPLRLIARGVFGKTPTDPIIAAEDAQTITATENNRRLLREGRVLIVLDPSVLSQTLE
jgi:hypothetical protein